MFNKEYATCEYCGNSEMCNVECTEAVDQEGNVIQENSYVCKDCFYETSY
jgi:hypothetical protein